MKMKVAVDVHYRDDHTKAVAVVFSHWGDNKPDQILVKYLEKAEKYVPGEFYKRELPCILELISELPKDQIDCIIVDGFVHLDDNGRPGLGGYLFEELTHRIPVIGVAKSSFANIEKMCLKIYRGESKNPLFITAAGLPLDIARDRIASMHGKHRMPDMLTQLDGETKKA